MGCIHLQSKKSFAFEVEINLFELVYNVYCGDVGGWAMCGMVDHRRGFDFFHVNFLTIKNLPTVVFCQGQLRTPRDT